MVGWPITSGMIRHRGDIEVAIYMNPIASMYRSHRCPQPPMGRRANAIVAAVLCITLFIVYVHPVMPAPHRRPSTTQPKPQPFEAKLAPGTMLVASRSLRDSGFAKTVILLIAYDEQGAQGLVINRPSPIQVSRALPNLPESLSPSPYIYLGGPVAQTQMRILVQTDAPSGEMQRVVHNVYMSGSPDVLKRLMNPNEPPMPFRAFAGYAGWGPGQLESEIERGGWHIFEADLAAIFDPDPDSVWPRLIRQRDLKWM